MPVNGTTVVRRQLGRRLRQLREAAGRTPAEVEAAKLASQVKLWRIETGRSAVKVADVWALCRLYGVDGTTTDALAALASATSERGWWENYADLMGTGVPLYIGLEETASELRTYESELVPGLFQTPDYFRALSRAEFPSRDGSDLERGVALRLERQRMVLDRPQPPKIIAVLNAAVLARHVGGPHTMAAQVKALVGLAAGPGNIAIMVVPWEAGAHAAMAGSFTILDFDDHDDPPVVHADGHLGALYVEQPAEVDEYRRVFAAICAKATPIAEFAR